LKGRHNTVGHTRSRGVAQTCVIHLPRNSFRDAGRQHWDAIAKALKPVYSGQVACSELRCSGRDSAPPHDRCPPDRGTSKRSCDSHGHAEGGAYSVVPVRHTQRDERSVVGMVLIESVLVERES
jgi:hypothetical protein